MSKYRNVRILCCLCFLLVVGVGSIFADPLQFNFTGQLVCGGYSSIFGCSNGIVAKVPDLISGSFGLDSSVPLTVNTGREVFTIQNPTVSDVHSDSVIGAYFFVWGELPGLNAQLQVIFEGRPFGPPLYYADLPPSTFVDHEWTYAGFYLRGETSSPDADRLPKLESYPDPGFSNPLFADGYISSWSPVSAIPEPSSLILVSLGLIAMLRMKRHE